MKTKRQSNLELLRLLAMVFIVTTHLINHGGLLWNPYLNKGEFFVSWTLFGLAMISINVFILISGYFLCESKFSISRIIKLALQVVTYSLTITLIFWIFTDVEHDKKYLVYSIIPILSDFYWFISMYIGMYILSPIMNKLVHTLTKKQLQFTIGVALFLVSIWPNIIYFSSAMNTAGGVSISWFLTMYLVGAYIRMYYTPTQKCAKPLLLAFSVYMILPLSRVLFEFLLNSPLKNIPFLDDMLWGYSIFYNYSTIPVTIAAVLLFIGFLNFKIQNNILSSTINLLSSSAFGVYLLHDHYYIRESIWNIINPQSWIGHWYLFPLSILVVLGVYLVGTCIEQIRQLIFKPILNSQKLHDWCQNIDKKLNSVWE